MTTPICCTGDCNQGRECPLRPRRRGWWPLLADMVRDSLVALPAMRHHPAAAFVIATLEPVWPCKPVPARSEV
jgi:hypothetical protein